MSDIVIGGGDAIPPQHREQYKQMTAWEAGFKAGQDYERAKWYWSAGSLSRAVNGLKERPTAPDNPFNEEGVR